MPSSIAGLTALVYLLHDSPKGKRAASLGLGLDRKADVCAPSTSRRPSLPVLSTACDQGISPACLLGHCPTHAYAPLTDFPTTSCHVALDSLVHERAIIRGTLQLLLRPYVHLCDWV